MTSHPKKSELQKGLTFDARELNAEASGLGLELVLAFGSRVSGELPVGEHSDLDVAVLDRQPPSWERFREVYGALSPVFSSYELDLAFLSGADPLFRFQIFRTAERLWGESFEFSRQQSYAYKAYIDSRDLRELERALFDRKLEYIDSMLND